MSRRSNTVQTVSDLYAALVRYRRRAIAFFLIAMTLVTVRLITCPRTYISEAKLFVRVGRESVALDPTATTGEVISLNNSREAEINSVLQMLGSRAIVEKVVDQLGPHMILGRNDNQQQPVPRDGGGKEQLGAGTAKRELLQHEKAVERLAENLKVSSPRTSSVIDLSCKAHSPTAAQTILKAVVETYLDEHVRVNRTPGSYQFFREQTALLKRQLDEAVVELRRAKDEYRVASMDERRRALQRQLDNVEATMFQIQADLSAARAKVAAQRDLLADLPYPLIKQMVTGQPADSTDHMRQQLYQLEIREEELRAKYTDDHPVVRAVQKQVAESKRILGMERPERDDATLAVLLSDQVNIASLLSRADALTDQREQLHAQLKTLNGQEGHIAELQRRRDLAESSYLTHARNLELARVDQALKLERISNVNVVQPATFLSKPVSPNKALNLIAGFLVALCGGIALAVCSDTYDRWWPVVRAEAGRATTRRPSGTRSASDLPEKAGDGWWSQLLRRNETAAAEYLHSAGRFRDILEIERMRADRSGTMFWLAVFTLPDQQRSETNFLKLARQLKRRVRATDHAGQLADGQIGVILWNTDESGAWKFATNALADNDRFLVQCDMYAYPARPKSTRASDDEDSGNDEDRSGMRREGPASGREAEAAGSVTARLERTGSRGLGRDSAAPSGSAASETAGSAQAAVATSPAAKPHPALETMQPVKPLGPLYVRPLPLWKRLIDVFGACVGLVVLSPLLCLTAVGIKLTSRGPILFRQRRDGLGGKPFTIYKFRTMRVGAEDAKAALRAQSEQDGPAFKMKHDPRITPLGRYLRKTCIDELPQLWNVLRGEMTLVGPRPLPCDESRQCSGWERRRLDVTPGLTCIWQVHGKSRVPFTEWMRMDIRYLRGRTPLQDLKLMLQTMVAVVFHRGSH